MFPLNFSDSDVYWYFNITTFMSQTGFYIRRDHIYKSRKNVSE